MAMGRWTSSPPIGPVRVSCASTRGADASRTTASAFRRNRPTSIVPADFDKDGFIDLAVPSRDGGQSHIYFNDGKAGFARTAPFGPPDAAARVGAAADFNGDGSLDLVVGDEKAASMVVYQNDGKGRLTAGFRVAEKARTRTPLRPAISIATAVQTSFSDTHRARTPSSSTMGPADSSPR